MKKVFALTSVFVLLATFASFSVSAVDCQAWTPTLDCSNSADIGEKVCSDVGNSACSAVCVSNADGTGVEMRKVECTSGKCKGEVCKAPNSCEARDLAGSSGFSGSSSGGLASTGSTSSSSGVPSSPILQGHMCHM